MEFTDIGFHAFFRENAETFTNRCTPVEDLKVWHGLSNTQPLLSEARTASEKIGIVERSLIKLLTLDQDTERSRRIQSAVQLIRQYQGNVSTLKLAEEAYLSERQFRRLFAEVKGCAPKHFSRLVRFTHLFTEVMQQQARVHWAELAYKYHYHDQMHLIKDFKHYSLYTPSHFPLQCFHLFSSLSFTMPKEMAFLQNQET